MSENHEWHDSIDSVKKIETRMNFRITILTIVIFIISSAAFGQVAGDYRSHGAGPASWNVLASWDRFNGTSWINPAPSAPAVADGLITIQAGHTIQVGSAVTADQIVVEGVLQVLNNFTLTVSGTTAGSAITVNSGGILEKQETNAGAAGTILGTAPTNTLINSGGIYKHNYTNVPSGGNPIAATWNPGSEIQIVGYTANVVATGANWGGNFATVRYNCTNQANGTTVDFAGLLTTIQQDLIVQATNTAAGTTGRIVFNSTGSSTTAIHGNISISGRSRVFLATTGSVNVNVDGSLSFASSIATTSQISGGASGTSNLTIGGSATFSAGNFTMASIAGGTGNLTVNNGNALNLNVGTFTVTTVATTGTVTLNGGGNLNVNAVPLNLATTGTGTINLNGGGNFNFSGTTLILATTGTGLVNVDGGDFNFSGTTLSMTTSGSGIINVINGGSFFYNTGNITCATTGVGAINVNNSGDFNMTSSGTMNFASGAGGSGTLTLAGGDFSATSGSIVETNTGAGTIAFTGSTIAKIDAAPARFTVGTVGLTVNKPSGILQIVTNDLTVGGTLTMTSGSLDINGQTLTLNGAIAPNNWTVSGSNFKTTLPSSLIIQTAGGAFPTTNMAIQDGSLFNTFTLNRVGTLPTSGNITVTTLNLFNGTLTHTPGTLTIADGGQIVRQAAAAILTNPPGAAGTYDVTYNNAAAITAAANYNELPASSSVLRDLTISGAGAVTFPVSLTTLIINRDLKITGAGILTGTTNQTITIGRDFFSNGGAPNFGQAGSSFIFLNTTAFPNATHTLSGAVAATPTFTSLTINGAVTASIGMALTGTSTLTVNSSSSLTATAGTTTFSGTNGITNNGTLGLNAVAIGTGNTLTALSVTMSISGNLSGNGTLTNTGGTIFFAGATVLSGSVKTFNNVTVNGGSSLGGAIGWRVNGNLVNNGSINFTAGTFTWGGTNANTFSGSPTLTTFSAFTIPSSGVLNLTLSGNMTISGILTLTAAAPSAIFHHQTANDLTLGGAANVFGNGTTFSSSGRVIFTNAAAVMGGSATSTKTLTSLRVNTGATLTIGNNTSYSLTGTGSLEVVGTLATTSGGTSTVTVSGTTTVISTGVSTTLTNLTITGALTAAGVIKLNGNFVNNGVFNHGNGTIMIINAIPAIHTISGTTSPTIFNNLTIGNGTGNVTVTNSLSPLSLRGALNINGATTNTFNTGGSAKFILISTGDVGSGTDGSLNGGSVGPITGSAILSGAMTVQRHMDSENRIWRYIASPVVGATIADLKNAFPVSGNLTDPSACPLCPVSPAYNPGVTSLFFYKASTQNYVDYPAKSPAAATAASANPLTNGVGYSAFVRQDGLVGPAIIKFPGTHPVTGAGISLSMAPFNADPNLCWSLVGNPYPSAIVWDPTNSLGTNGWTGSANVGSSVKVRDNGSGGTYQTISIGGTISSGQAFWVQTTGASPVLTIHENAKTSALSSTFFRLGGPLSDQLTIQMTKVHTGGNKDKAQTDEAVIQIQSGASANLDYFDSPKWNNQIQQGANVFDLSILTSDAKAVTTNSLPSISCSQQIKLNIADLLFDSAGVAETSAMYYLTFSPSGGMKALKWTLHDDATGSDIDVSDNPTYSFTVDNSIVATKAANRFYLVISSPASINTSSAVSATSSICTGTDAIIKVASQPGMTYAAEINGLLLPFSAQGDGNDISIFIPSDTLAATNNIRVKANSGCDQQFLNQTVQVSTENFAIAQANNVYRCSPGSVTLTVTGATNSGNYNWYSNSTDGSPLFTGASFVTPTLKDTATFYVAALNKAGCEGGRVAVQAQIGNNGDSLAVVQLQTICSGTEAALVASGAPSGGSYHWYKGPGASATLVGQSDTLKQVLYKPIKFYLSSVDAEGCESNRIEFMTDVMKFYPSISTSFLNAPICKVGTQSLSATSDQTSMTYRWYSSADAVLPITEDLIFTTPTISASTDYYVSAISNSGCESPRQVFTVPVNTSDPSDSLAFQTDKICSSGGTSILASVGSNIAYINWYESATSTTPITNTNEFDTPELNESRSYYASAVDQSGCEGTRRIANLDVVNLDSAKIVIDPLQITVINYTTGIQWYLNGDLLAFETNPTIAPKVSGDYTLTVASHGCTMSEDIVFTNTAIEKDLSTTVILYPNPASSAVYVQYSGVQPLTGELFDITGKPVKSVSLLSGKTTRIEIQDLNHGLYFIKFVSENGVFFKKFIIQ
jgi:hypothetical protein